MEKKEKVTEIYGVYAFVREDFQHPPLKDISRTIKASKHDASILLKYGKTIKF